MCQINIKDFVEWLWQYYYRTQDGGWCRHGYTGYSLPLEKLIDLYRATQ